MSAGTERPGVWLLMRLSMIRGARRLSWTAACVSGG